MNSSIWFYLLLMALVLQGCGGGKMEQHQGTEALPEKSLTAQIARFAPMEITADVSRLSAEDRKALDKIIEAAKWMDEIFLRQVWSGNVALRQKLEAEKSPEGQERLRYFRTNAGPWSRLDQNAPFIEGVPQLKPLQASFYPDDITKDEFEAWVKTLSETEQRRATGFFYVIRRAANGALKTVPYSEEYEEFLKPAGELLRQASALTKNASLRAFLAKRADAFASNDYYESDIAWMELDSAIDVTIGPYETYEDELFNYKAAFEAFVAIRDDAESAKLARFSRYLQEIEDHLPIDPRYRNPKIGAAAPIRVVDEVFCSGDANRGVQTAAFNLPNDERVIREKGSARVMLKNVQEAKFNKALLPLSRVVLHPSQQSALSFDAFFTHILAHELMHGLGPHNIQVAGKQSTVRQQLKELYSVVEEAKADITGLFALQYLVDQGVVPRPLEQQMYVTFLASMFRSARFGIGEAHARGVALQFNYLMDQGGIEASEEFSTFHVNPSRIKDVVRNLTHELLTVEAEGSYEKAKSMLDRFAVIRPVMQKALDRLGSVPVDIEPRFPLAHERHSSL